MAARQRSRGETDDPDAMSWKERRNEQAGVWLASAKRKHQFLTNTRIHIFKAQRVLAFVTQDLKHRRPTLFGNLDPGVVQVHDVHLERLHEKVLVVPAACASQRHARLLFYRQKPLPN